MVNKNGNDYAKGSFNVPLPYSRSWHVIHGGIIRTPFIPKKENPFYINKGQLPSKGKSENPFYE